MTPKLESTFPILESNGRTTVAARDKSAVRWTMAFWNADGIRAGEGARATINTGLRSIRIEVQDLDLGRWSRAWRRSDSRMSSPERRGWKSARFLSGRMISGP